MKTSILGIDSYLPAKSVTNADLAKEFPDWSVERIAEKTGILERHLAAPDQCASDLAWHAAQNLFSGGICQAVEIDYLLLCTQSPDYFLPTTACLLQQRLGIPQHAGALDFNLGCSGYIYGLGLAQGLITTGQASKVLLLTAETYSKHLDPQDRSSITIFGDGAAATVLAGTQDDGSVATPAYVYGTDGSGGEHLIVRKGGIRQSCANTAGDAGKSDLLWMNGPEIFHFSLRVVPACVRSLLQKADLQIDDIDLFVFHQANRYMLDHLRKKLQIPEDKFYVSLASCGNTVSSTIPIALQSALNEGRLKDRSTSGAGWIWGWPILGCNSAYLALSGRFMR